MSDMTNRNHDDQIMKDNYQARLRQAVHSSVEAPPFLESRIRNRIRMEAEVKPRGFRIFNWVPAAVALAVVMGLGIAYQLGHLRMTAESQESYIASVSNRVATLMRVGLGDHIHCAVFRKPKTPPPVEQFVRDMGPQYAGLIPVVREHVPARYTMTGAHQCSYHKRKFVHLTLAGDGKLISVILARKQDGESFQTEGFLPSLVQSGLPVYQSGVQRFAMHAFESRDHLVYVVSDLPGKSNEEMMVALSAPVKEFLSKIEL